MAATHWPLETLWQAIEPGLPGFTVEVVAEIDSSNAELMRRARAGRLDPVLLVTEHQSAGRGRLGRQWLDRPATSSQPGSLMFSLGLTLSPQDWSGLSLAVGLSLADSLHPDIALKWPNDLWWRDRKLAGILVETLNWSGHASGQANGQASSHATPSSRYVVIGVGMNIDCPPADGLATPPVGLGELIHGITAQQALALVAAPLVGTLRQFEQRGFAPLAAAFNARDALGHVAVTLSDGSFGEAQGVDPTGALLVQTAQGLQRVTSAEVSVRPVAPPSLHLI